jgi:hypothetical protein
MNKKNLYIIILSLTSFLMACKSGFEKEKTALGDPETFMVVDTIFRTGENRLTTRVEANWWGNAPGGFIVGYEISTDNQQSWHFTKTQDSSFLLNIPPGQDSADVVVYVRAIDNIGRKDPTPASTLFPIKNSKPKVSFIFSQPLGGIASQNPVLVFPVIKYSINGTDPDGQQDLEAFELFINDTNAIPFILPANATAFTVVAENPKGNGGLSKVYINNNTNPLPGTIDGLNHNTFNIFYVRAVDKAQSKSSYVGSPAIWVKKVSSDILVVNAYSSSKIAVQNFYTNRLKNNGILVFDTLQATEIVSSNYTQLQPDFLTQSRTFSLFKKMIWFADNASFSFSLGQRTTGPFFDNGGSLFMSVAINSSFDPLSNFLDWTPIRQLVNPPAGSIFRVNINSLVSPMFQGWPILKSTAIIPSARPFEIPSSTNQVSYDSVYAGGIIESKSGQPPVAWNGISTVIAKRTNVSTGNTNFIISSIPLEQFNGNANSDSLFKKIIIDELKF